MWVEVLMARERVLVQPPDLVRARVLARARRALVTTGGTSLLLPPRLSVRSQRKSFH
jgi:hypothetical protein